MFLQFVSLPTHLCLLLLPAQALWLPPQSELGQCRAFVGFWSVLMGLLLPALLLVPRPSREEQRQGGSPRGRQEDQPPPSPRCQRQLDSFEGFVTAGLRGLRYPSSRPMPFLLSWWLTLSLLWFASIGGWGWSGKGARSTLLCTEQQACRRCRAQLFEFLTEQKRSSLSLHAGLFGAPAGEAGVSGP